MINDEDYDDEPFMFSLSYDEVRSNITLMVSRECSITPHEYMACLIEFIEQYKKDVDGLFDQGEDFLQEKH